MLETFLRGLLIGGLVGTSIGPVAVWGAWVRRERYSHAFVIILGAASADVVLAAAILGLMKWAGFSIALIAAALEQNQYLGSLGVLGLLTVGVMLLRMASRDMAPPTLSHAWRFVGASAGTLRIDTAALAAFFMAILGRVGDSPWVFLPAFFIGAVVAWMGSVELFYRLQTNAGRLTACVIRIAGLACVWGALWRLVTPAQAY